MRELPAGWTSAPVGKLFKMYAGGTPDKSNPAYWGGPIPWLSSGDIKGPRITGSSLTITEDGLRNSSAKMCRAGSILLVVRSGVLKHTLPVSILEIDAAINQDIKCLDSGDDELNAWLALGLRSASSDILAENREGTTVQSVKTETITSFEFAIPPRAEQRRIVAKLDDVLGRVNDCQQRLDKVPKLLARLRQSVLAAAFSGDLTKYWRLRMDATHQSWRDIPVSELLDAPLANGRSVPDGPGFPVLRLTCLKNGGIDLRERKLGSWDEKAAKPFVVTRGDFLVARGNGSLSRVGRGGLVEVVPDPVAFPDTLIRIRPRQSIVLPEYFALAWAGPALRDQIEATARTSAGIWKISQRDIEGYLLPIPTIDEQGEVVRRVRQTFAIIDRLGTRCAGGIGMINRVTQAILNKAFRGELVGE